MANTRIHVLTSNNEKKIIFKTEHITPVYVQNLHKCCKLLLNSYSHIIKKSIDFVILFEIKAFRLVSNKYICVRML